jgi:hypothetical protein
MNVLSLITLSSANIPSTWNPVAGIRTSVLDSTNPQFLRTIRLDGTALVLSTNNPAVEPVILPITEFLAACATANPALTWPPVISTQPANQTVASPSASGFTIVANAETAINYQWQVSTNAGFSWTNLTNGSPYSGVTTSSLHISSSAGLNGNYYRCIATNASGSTNSVKAILNALTDPSFTTQPNSIPVQHPFGATFTVATVVNSSPSYQWQISVDTGVTWNNVTASAIYTGSLTTTLTITNSTGLNGQQFRCIVTDTAGTATSNAATLTVT